MNPTLEDLFDRALLRLKRGASNVIRGGAIAGALLSTAPQTGCADAPATDEEGLDGVGPGGKGDWASDEGERRPDLISFTGDAWSECRDPSSRTGC
jgi:hypothetical protein